MMRGRQAVLTAVLLAGFSATAVAQDVAPGAGLQIGRIEYMAGCAQCHGIEGRGDGVIADYLTMQVPDLTQISRQNGGIFPAGIIAEVIEGGLGSGVHGTQEMPAWGDRYSVEAYAVLGWPHDPEERQAFVRARILALVEYVASLQE